MRIIIKTAIVLAENVFCLFSFLKYYNTVFQKLVREDNTGSFHTHTGISTALASRKKTLNVKLTVSIKEYIF